MARTYDDPEYPPMGHGFPRSYIPHTPQEILYDHERILGSSARMYSQGMTMLRQPRVESTAYTMVTSEGLGSTYIPGTTYAQVKTGTGQNLVLRNFILQPPWLAISIDLALAGLGGYILWQSREKEDMIIGAAAVILGGGLLAHKIWLVSSDPVVSYKEEAVSTEE
jgi:hypothetical protein